MRGLIGTVFSLLLLLQIAAWFQVRHLLLWKICLAVREFGHWAAALLLLLLLIALLFKGARSWALPLLLLAGGYAAPAAWAWWQGPAIQRRVAMALNLPAAVTPAFSIGQAFGLQRHPAREVRALAFAGPDGTPLGMDFFPGEGEGPRPFVVVVHSGGWDSGSRAEFADLNLRLAALGISVAAIDYRLAPAATWPAPKQDVLAALVFLKTHAASLGLDPSRFALMGRSAGGQIAERVAYGEHLPGLRALVAFYAPADLNFAYAFSKPDDILHSRQLEEAYLGGPPAAKPAAFDDASAPRFVTQGAPPTLLLHGPGDPLVWFKQSERLKARLDAARVPNALLALPFATHGFDWTLDGPDGQIAAWAVTAFLKAKLDP